MPGGRPRGGRKAYAQRTDLNGAQPVTAGPSQQYGQRKQLEDAQRAVPAGTPELAPAAAGPPQRPEGMPTPGSLGDLFADSTDPNEHVMSGAAMGPGPGPEAFGGGMEDQMRQEDLQRLAPWLPALERMANQPGTGPGIRWLVRSLKGAL